MKTITILYQDDERLIIGTPEGVIKSFNLQKPIGAFDLHTQFHSGLDYDWKVIDIVSSKKLKFLGTVVYIPKNKVWMGMK